MLIPLSPPGSRDLMYQLSSHQTEAPSLFWKFRQFSPSSLHCLLHKSNDIIERTRCQLKDSLCSRLAGVDWPKHIPWLLLDLRAATKEDTTSAELIFGAPGCSSHLVGLVSLLSRASPSQFVEAPVKISSSVPTRPFSLMRWPPPHSAALMNKAPAS